MEFIEPIAEFAKTIGYIVGCIISCLTLAGICIKPVRSKISAWIQKESHSNEIENHSNEIEEKLDELSELLKKHTEQDEEKQQAIAKQNESLEDQKDAIKSLLRDSITTIYYKNLPREEIKAYELEDLTQLKKSYEKLKGNSYVETIFKQMTEEWHVIK